MEVPIHTKLPLLDVFVNFESHALMSRPVRAGALAPTNSIPSGHNSVPVPVTVTVFGLLSFGPRTTPSLLRSHLRYVL